MHCRTSKEFLLSCQQTHTWSCVIPTPNTTATRSKRFTLPSSAIGRPGLRHPTKATKSIMTNAGKVSTTQPDAAVVVGCRQWVGDAPGTPLSRCVQDATGLLISLKERQGCWKPWAHIRYPYPPGNASPSPIHCCLHVTSGSSPTWVNTVT